MKQMHTLTLSSLLKEGGQLENEKLVSLIRQRKNVSENMGILYQQNEAFIRSIVKKFSGFAEIDDLMQEAYFGLVNAVEHYDLDGEAQFTTYATYAIRGYCQRYINKNRSIKIPVWIQDKIREYKKLSAKHGDHLNVEMVKQKLNLSQKQYDQMMQFMAISDRVSLDTMVKSKSENLTIAETVADETDVEESFLEAERNEAIMGIWNCLDDLHDDRKKMIMLLRYKLNLTQDEVASNIHLSRSSIGYIESKCLKQLKELDKIQQLAELYDYDSSAIYKGGYSSFKNHFESVVERIALNHVEVDERLKKVQDDIQSCC